MFLRTHQSYKCQLMNSDPESGSIKSQSKGDRSRMTCTLSLVGLFSFPNCASRKHQVRQISVNCTVYAKFPDASLPQWATVSASRIPGSGFCQGPRLTGMISFSDDGLVKHRPPPETTFSKCESRSFIVPILIDRSLPVISSWNGQSLSRSKMVTYSPMMECNLSAHNS